MDPTKLIKELTLYLERHQKDKLIEIRTGKDRLTVKFFGIAEMNPELGDEYLEEPEEFLRAAEIVIEELTERTGIPLRVKNPPESIQMRIRNIRAKSLDKVVAVTGTINAISDVRPMIVSARFECPSCGNTITVLQLQKTFKEPTHCGCGRKGRFRLLAKEYVDTQKMVLEETTESLEGNEQPRKINVILTKGLTNEELDKKNTPGSKVTVIGVLKERGKDIRGRESVDREYFIIANHIEPLEYGYKDIKLSKEDIKAVKDLSQKPKLLDLMVKSFAPSIFGHGMVKMAIILQLFGGNTIRDNDQKVIRRGQFNILLVGDAGMGKTKLIKYVGRIAPKFRYSSGTGATGVGLTAGVLRDDFIGGFSLHAGVLVLAHGGVAGLDELDKIDKDERGKLHEALAENTVTINKATIRATLRAETAALAAANPKLGRFDVHDTLASQIDLEPALLSRFDFVYPLVDKQEDDTDSKIFSKMLSVANKEKESIEPEISNELFTKYITYAKSKPGPVFTKKAEKLADQIYVNFRKMGSQSGAKTISITPRYGEALIRLSQAVAKAHLKDKVTEEHVEQAKEVLWFSLSQLAIDPETGTLDTDRLTMSISSSKRNLIKSIVREIKEECEALKEKMVSEQTILNNIKSSFEIESEDFFEIVDKLKKEGDIYEPKKGFLALVGG